LKGHAHHAAHHAKPHHSKPHHKKAVHHKKKPVHHKKKAAHHKKPVQHKKKAAHHKKPAKKSHKKSAHHKKPSHAVSHKSHAKHAVKHSAHGSKAQHLEHSAGKAYNKVKNSRAAHTAEKYGKKAANSKVGKKAIKFGKHEMSASAHHGKDVGNVVSATAKYAENHGTIGNFRKSKAGKMWTHSKFGKRIDSRLSKDVNKAASSKFAKKATKAVNTVKDSKLAHGRLGKATEATAKWGWKHRKQIKAGVDVARVAVRIGTAGVAQQQLVMLV